jgi:putative membrane protein
MTGVFACLPTCAKQMDTPIKEKPAADLRDYLAEERTFLAWVRTGIALTGFGFVLAQFGLFADEHQLTRHALGLQPHDLSLWCGAALFAVGVTVNLFSARRYMRLASELKRGEFVHRSACKQGVVVAMFLALLGIAMAIYMIRILPQPPDTLHAQSAQMPASKGDDDGSFPREVPGPVAPSRWQIVVVHQARKDDVRYA